MALRNLSQPTYEPAPMPPAGTAPGLDSMAHGFLGLVQPNAFPAELLSRLIHEPAHIMEPATYKQVLSYEMGFLVCAAIGLLFILLMPLGGLCFCCCRCCGHCGGRKYQKQDERTGCRRRTLCTALLLLSGLLLGWNVCAFVANTRISQAVDSSFGTFNSSVGNLRTYLDNIPQQVDFVVNSSHVPLDQANASLRDISSVLGGRIVSSVGRELQAALDSAARLLEDLDILRTDLRDVINSSQRLQDGLDGVSHNLSALCSRIEHTLESCGQSCKPQPHCPRAPANLSLMPDAGHQLELLDNLTRSDPRTVIQQANQTLHDTPQRVENETRDLVVDAQAQLDQIRGELQQARDKLSSLDALSNVSATLHGVAHSAARYEPLVQAADHYRWIAGICLCCLVLLVVLSYALGLVLGVLGLDPATLPMDRGCLPNIGGNLLLAGVGFSFLFSWLLMLLVLLSFLLGGNGYMLVCRAWHDRQLFQFLETQGMIPGFSPETLGLRGQTLNLSQVYNACQHDAPLWSALDLGQTVPLDELLNLSQYTSEIHAAFAETNLTLAPVVLLSTEQTDLLRTLGNTTRLTNLTADRQKVTGAMGGCRGQSMLTPDLQGKVHADPDPLPPSAEHHPGPGAAAGAGG
ncbi:PREDICTED: prominin-1-A-like [Gavialis gangeticus]|uniref:prominin-1-A-like n=1 Tax=Gavialis gangeticus TaxID=94835 RepID=UPI00092E9527|nr:PREDICTED: prominin-1-A-like [Gavialis gangeticus]